MKTPDVLQGLLFAYMYDATALLSDCQFLGSFRHVLPPDIVSQVDYVLEKFYPDLAMNARPSPQTITSIFRVQRGRDLYRFSDDMREGLPFDEDLLLAEYIFDSSDGVYGIFVDTLQRILDGRKRDDHQLIYNVQEFVMCDFLAREMGRRQKAKPSAIIRSYCSSYGQPLAAVAFGVDTLGNAIMRQPLNYLMTSRLVQAYLSSHFRLGRELLNGKGYSASASRQEIAARLSLALMRNARDASWSGRKLILELPLSDLDTSGALDILRRFAWPPDPEDVILQSLQRVLGWQFDIDTSGDHVSFSIDFGDSYYEEKDGAR